MIFNTLKNLETYLAPYHDLWEITDESEYRAKKDIVFTVELPKFYTFDAPTPAYTITVVEHPTEKLTATVTSPDGTMVKEFHDAVEAYDYVKRELCGDVIWAGDVALIDPKNSTRTGMVMAGSRLLLSHTDKDTEYLAKSHYVQFLFTAEQYYKNPEDFMASYRFVKNHPAFWTKQNPKQHYWITDYSNIWLEITTNNAGELVYMFEGGAAIEPDRVNHYHDLRLDVYAPSFEDGYVRFAALVDKFYHLDGSERPNVSYIPSELEKTLNELVNAITNEEGTYHKLDPNVSNIPSPDNPCGGDSEAEGDATESL